MPAEVHVFPCLDDNIGVLVHDPASGATDRHGRLWGSNRVVVCDSSLHPTNGSVNPTLTIVANAFRVAEHLVGDWPR